MSNFLSEIIGVDYIWEAFYMENKTAGIVGIIAGLITIFIFITGKPNLRIIFSPPPPKTLIVSKQTPGDYTTINAALITANFGDKIIIKPGIYKESIKITKKISLLGDGNRDDIVIESINSDCITMETSQADISNLTIRSSTEGNLNFFAGINISRGKIGIENCDISSNSQACIKVSGFGDPTIRNCKIHDSKESGIFFSEHGSGTLDNCDIFNNSGTGITVYNWTAPYAAALLLKECKIYKNKKYGMYFNNTHDGAIINFCNIFNNSCIGIEISDSSFPEITNCKIYRNGKDGLFIYKNSKGNMRSCDIFNNSCTGVTVSKNSSLDIFSGLDLYK